MFDFVKKKMSMLIWKNKSNWDQLPSDLVVKIVQNLDLADSIRVSIVCKHWRSIVIQNKLQLRREVTWLRLPHDDDRKSNFFFDLSDGMFYNIKLPKTLQGGWCCGSSKGWLVFMVLPRRRSKFTPKLILFNPISGEQVSLPCVTTLPFDETYLYVGYGDKVVEFAKYIIKVELSSADAPNCIVAVKFYNPNLKLGLALCKPGDERWTIFDDDEDCGTDILFYNGELYVLISSGEAATHNMKVGEHDEIIIRLIPNNCTSIFETPEVIWIPEGESELVWIGEDASYESYLVESSDGELLIVHKIMDIMQTVLDEGEEEDDVGEVVRYHKVSRFEVFKIDVSTSKFTKLINLGNQALCVSETISLSVPATAGGLKRNCIFFLEDFDANYSRESGVFHLEDGRIQRFFPTRNSVNYPPPNTDPIYYPMNWFRPNLAKI